MTLSIRNDRLPTLIFEIALFATSIICVAHAQELGHSKACTDASFAGEAECLNSQLALSKAQLDDQYEAKISGLKDKEHDHLLLSQETWVAYVHAQCDVVGDRMGLSVQWTAIPVQECMLDMINDRVGFLIKLQIPLEGGH